MRFNQIAEFACILMLLAAFGELDAKSRPSPRAAQSFPTMTAAIDEITTQYKTRVGLEYASNDVDRTPINQTFPSRQSQRSSIALSRKSLTLMGTHRRNL